MNDFLHEWKNVTYGVMSNQLPTIIEALENSVERAEQKAKVLPFVYRCRVDGERLDDDTEMVFKSDRYPGKFHCFKHHEQFDEPIHCAVINCREPVRKHAHFCEEHCFDAAFGNLRFGEDD